MTARGGVSFALNAFLETERKKVEEALAEALDELLPEFPGPTREAVRHGVTTGGKRLRPILCVSAYGAAGGTDPSGALRLAASLELIHAYSLMHDDLPCMDDAPLRRGRPTPHTLHGEEATMLGGAALIPAAHLHAWRACARMGLDESMGRQVVRALAAASGGEGMVGGQVLDLLGEGVELKLEELDRLHAMKTGALLTASLRIGALAAEASPATLRALVEYGHAIGLAFQVTDDILDATSDVGALGKEPSDADLAKSTYVSLLGVEPARAAADDLVQRALEALGASGILSPALEALARYTVHRAH